MTRILILGGAGMLGHKLAQTLRETFETWVTFRAPASRYERFGIFDPGRAIGGVDASDFDTVVGAVAAVRPEVIVNCIGIIKQLPAAHDPIISLSINSLLPHRLQRLARAAGARLIHLSTDCVFRGTKGMYTEDDLPDAADLYGRSKSLGETSGPDALTLRTSIIGRELETQSGLMEWFLGSRGKRVNAFSRAIYSGFSTQAMSRIIEMVVTKHPDLDGLWQVSSEPITKLDLLGLLRDSFRLDVEIVPDSTVAIDRSLDSSRFRALTGFTPPSWPEMVEEMAADPTPYDRWRR
jgi:dTDP-4-dehydrorhamnose reductase